MNPSNAFAAPESVPRITVVVLTHNRVRVVLETVARLLALPDAPHLIVADNGSTDATVKLIGSLFPSVRIVQCLGDLGASAHSRAVALAHTDYVAFTDDDTWWEPGALTEAVRVFDSAPRVAVLSARVVVGDEGETDARCTRLSASPLDRNGLPGPALTSYLAGACVFRRAALLAVNGDEPLRFASGDEERVALDLLAQGHAIVYGEGVVARRYPGGDSENGSGNDGENSRRANHRRDGPDASLRRRIAARHAAWVAWQRLPLASAVGATLRAFGVLAREHALWRDTWPLIAGIGAALKRRRPAPPNVLAMRRKVLDAERLEQARAARAMAEEHHQHPAR